MSVIGELLVEINGDNSGLKKSLGDSGSAVTSGVSKMVKSIGLAAIAWKAIDLAIQGIDYNKAAEQAEIAFGSFLGSASAAKDMIEDLRDLAKETPLEFAEVRDAAKQLSAFGIEAGRIIPTMRTLADVSAGLGIPVKDLAYLFGTIKTQGKAMTVDLMQFANRGIPIWSELEKVTGKTNTELRKMVEAGQIGFPQIEQAFSNMTSEGGKFFNMAVKQMDSLAGSQSNLNDAFDSWLGMVTSGLTGPLKQFNNELAAILTWDKDALKGWQELNEPINKWAATLYGIKNTQKEILDNARGIKETWDLLDQRGKAYLDKQAKIAEEERKRKEAAAELAKELAGRTATEESIKQEYSNQLGLIANIIQAGKDKAAVEEEEADRIGAIADAYTPLNQAQQEYVDSLNEGFSLIVGPGRTAMMAFQEELDAIDAKTTTWEDTWVSLGTTMKSVFSDTFMELGKSLKQNEDAWQALADGALDAIGAVIKGIGDELTALAAADTYKAFAALASGVGAAAAPGFFASAGLLAAGAAAAYTAAGAISAFADGTDFAPGGLALVGERGPELVELPRGSKVKTAEETARMGRGGSSTIQIYLDSRVIAESTVNLVDNGVVKMRSLAR